MRSASLGINLKSDDLMPGLIAVSPAPGIPARRQILEV
jgi:hypothetical protein